MSLRFCKRIILDVVDDVNRKNIFSFAAAFSYYFILALFPALIALAALVAFLPIPNLFATIVGAMAKVIPAASMALVREIVADAISGRRGAFLSFGVLGALWTCSSGFSAVIDALNVAYEVPETRSFWRTRVLTLELTLLVGTLIIVAFALMIVGPEFGQFLTRNLGLSWEFAHIWPLLRYVLAATLIVHAIEGLYFLGPNIKQRFRASLPGAILAVVGWLVLSDGLSFYFRRLGHLNRTYGALAGVIALLVWLYWSGFMVLLGADVNAIILKYRGRALSIRVPSTVEASQQTGSTSDAN